jgi:TfoX/Sxy family transcriptional regulator of competence genes
MAYDETLAARLRDQLADVDGVTEKEMFGGLAFLVHGNMCVGVSGDELMGRVGKEGNDAALARPGARQFDMTGRPMAGWVIVAPEVLVGDALAGWVETCLAFVRTLPPKG